MSVAEITGFLLTICNGWLGSEEIAGQCVHIKVASNCGRLLIYRVVGGMKRQAIKFNSVDNVTVFISIKQRSEFYRLLSFKLIVQTCIK
jgi:hypothetical protein